MIFSERDRRATIADVAAAAKVAKSTASLAFSAPERVSEAARARIFASSQALGYSPNPIAQSLRTGRNNLFGFVSGLMTNPHTGEVLEYVQNTADEHSHLIITAPTHGAVGISADRSVQYLRKFAQLQVRTALIVPATTLSGYIEQLKSVDIRLVTYGNKLPGIDCDHVGLSNRLATHLLTRHLLERGHRKIGHIAGRLDLSSGQERLQGVRKTLADSGISLEDRWIGNGEYNEDTAYGAALGVLSLADRPTALVCANNVTAFGTLRAIRNLGLSCPGDVSLVSVDKLPWGDLITPPMTCAVQPLKEMAHQAAMWTIERLNDEYDYVRVSRREMEFSPRLTLGHSVSSAI